MVLRSENQTALALPGGTAVKLRACASGLASALLRIWSCSGLEALWRAGMKAGRVIKLWVISHRLFEMEARWFTYLCSLDLKKDLIFYFAGLYREMTSQLMSAMLQHSGFFLLPWIVNWVLAWCCESFPAACGTLLTSSQFKSHNCIFVQWNMRNKDLV